MQAFVYSTRGQTSQCKVASRIGVERSTKRTSRTILRHAIVSPASTESLEYYALACHVGEFSSRAFNNCGTFTAHLLHATKLLSFQPLLRSPGDSTRSALQNTALLLLHLSSNVTNQPLTDTHTTTTNRKHTAAVHTHTRPEKPGVNVVSPLSPGRGLKHHGQVIPYWRRAFVR